MVMAAMFVLPCCEELDDDPQKYLEGQKVPVLPLDGVAEILSEIPIGEEQVREVYNAVTSSSWNGYDEEYMMKDLFNEPGTGVGDDRIGVTAMASKRAAMKAKGIETKSSSDYDLPLRSLIEEYLYE